MNWKDAKVMYEKILYLNDFSKRYDVLQVINEAKFIFIDENLGFAINNGTISNI